jgi:hypothetical protein
MTRTSAGPDIQGLPAIGLQTGTNGSDQAITGTGYSDTAGTWNEVIVSTTGETHWLSVNLRNMGASAAAVNAFASIGVGAAASEVAVVSNWAVGGALNVTVLLPVYIPKGSRVSFRLSSASATNPVTPTVIFSAYDRAEGDRRSSPSSLGALGVTGTNLGTDLTSDNTWVQLTSATTQHYQGVIWAGCCSETAWSSRIDRFDIGVGASAAEVTRSSVMINMSSAETYQGIVHPTLTNIPAGSRVAARSTGATTNTMRVAPLAIPVR